MSKKTDPKKVKFTTVNAALKHWKKWLTEQPEKDVRGIEVAARAWFDDDSSEHVMTQSKKTLIEFIMGFDPITTPGGLLQFFATLDHCPGCGEWLACGDLAVEECLCDPCANKMQK